MSNATNNIFEKGQLIRIAGFGYIIGFVFHLIFILEFALLNLNHLLWFNIIFSLPAFLVAFLLSKKGFLYASLFLATVEIISHQVFALLLVGKEGGFQLLLLILVIGSILTENWKNTLIIIGGLVSIIYIGLIWWDFSDYRIYHLPPFQLNILSTTNAVGMLAVIILMFTYYLSREEKLLNQLKQSNHIKDKIVATVSHDLRNPIKSLKPLIKTLQFEKGSSVQSAKTITALNKHINETDHLLDNLLHWASLQIKGIYNMPTSLDLAKVLNKELELFEPLARDKEIEIDK
ncbi:MAG: hypothetical protein OEX02_14070, partial [Cyclobacteriaceae bacterium]|nr:hypothetical protein [Cyclobacteriaceae bacterium]